MAPRIVVIVLTYNASAYIGACLDALRANTRPDAKVVVIDNASSDGTYALVRECHPEVEAIAMDANHGVSRGNNFGLARYDADHYVLLNPDTEVGPGWLEALVEEAGSDPRIGIVGGKLLFPDGRIQHAGGEAAPTGPRHFGVLAPAEAYDEPADVDFVTFACALIKRDVVDRIGYLDERYSPFYYEDSDYCFRARAAGFRVRYTPRCLVTHHEGAAMTRKLSVEKARIIERNRLRFKLIHDPPSWWLRSAWQEGKTLVGHTLRGRGRAIWGAWADAARSRRELRERRRARDGYVGTMWTPGEPSPSPDRAKEQRP